MARFIITTQSPAMVNGRPNPEGLEEAPRREARAIRKARRLRAEGKSVLLFRVISHRHDESDAVYMPVSLKTREYHPGQHANGRGHNTETAGIPVESKAIRTLGGRVVTL